MKTVKRAKIKELIEHACHANGIPEFARKIRYEWSRRMTRAAGMARSKDNSMKFSVPIMARMDMDEQHNTVVHETCHLIAQYKAKLKGKRIKPHGSEWKHTMHLTGYDATRCHTIDLGSIRKKKAGTKAFTCGCADKIYWLGAERARKAIKHQAFSCKKCGQKLIVRRKVIAIVSQPA